jgi:hypothetical protein
MDEVAEARMSRTQQVVIALLSLAVVMIFGCFGAYALIYLKYGHAPLLAMPGDTTSSVVGTPEAAPAADATDYGYRLCFQDISAGYAQLAEDFALVRGLAAEDPQAVCETASPLNLEQRASGLRAAHGECPEPLASHLQAARELFDSSLSESAEAGVLMGRHCSEGQDASWLEEAASHIEAADHLWSQGDQEMEAYYQSY